MRGFSPSSSQSSLSAVSIAAAVHGSVAVERLVRGAEDARVEVVGRRRDVLEEESCEVGKLAEAPDLLLHERRRRPDPVVGPIGAALVHELDEPLGVLLGRQRAEVDAVHPVELRIVERAGARADRLEREPLDDLVAGEDRGLAVRRPADQGEEVHERLREVSRRPELVHRDRAVALGELLPVGAEDVRDVRVHRRLVAERAEDLDLLRGVRDVVVAADHVRDRVVHVLHRRGEVVGRRDRPSGR